MSDVIRSMTGFGRGECQDEHYKITVEMKSVNHRYLDLGIRLPKRLNPYEADVRNIIREHAQRGKIDIFVTYESLSGGDSQVCYNSEVAGEYMRYLVDMAQEHGLENDVRGVSRLASMPGVLTLDESEVNGETLEKILEVALRQACQSFCEARTGEGEKLKDDLLEKLDTMRGLVDSIEERSPRIVAEYREKLFAKVAEMLGDAQIDESRLLTEVTIFADKAAVDEEIVRLKAHIDAMEKELRTGGAVGRKLDFIAQEMNREANTTLSKANDLTLSDIAIELKTIIEKIREQIQNLE